MLFLIGVGISVSMSMARSESLETKANYSTISKSWVPDFGGIGADVETNSVSESASADPISLPRPRALQRTMGIALATLARLLLDIV